jgi:hypothetical protein
MASHGRINMLYRFVVLVILSLSASSALAAPTPATISGDVLFGFSTDDNLYFISSVGFGDFAAPLGPPIIGTAMQGSVVDFLSGAGGDPTPGVTELGSDTFSWEVYFDAGPQTVPETGPSQSGGYLTFPGTVYGEIIFYAGCTGYYIGDCSGVSSTLTFTGTGTISYHIRDAFVYDGGVEDVFDDYGFDFSGAGTLTQTTPEASTAVLGAIGIVGLFVGLRRTRLKFA